MEEVRLESRCCGAEVDFTGGGYDGEEIVPVYNVCVYCRNKCELDIKENNWKYHFLRICEIFSNTGSLEGETEEYIMGLL